MPRLYFGFHMKLLGDNNLIIMKENLSYKVIANNMENNIWQTLIYTTSGTMY